MLVLTNEATSYPSGALQSYAYGVWVGVAAAVCAAAHGAKHLNLGVAVLPSLPCVGGFLSFWSPDEIANEALFRACRAYGLGEQFNAAAQDEGTFAEWLDELPIEVAAATARLLKHYTRSGAWVEITPGTARGHVGTVGH